MRKIITWALGGVVAAALLAGAAFLAARHWVGSDDFRARVAGEASAALGVPVVLGGVTVTVWPLPALALDRVEVKTQRPLRAERIEVRPSVAALWHGRLEIAYLVLRQAELSQGGLDEITLARQRKEQSTPGNRSGKTQNTPQTEFSGVFLPQRLRLEHVTWIDPRGLRTTLDAQAQLSEGGLPQVATLVVRQGRLQGAQLGLQRTTATIPTWAVEANVGGGTVRGEVQLVLRGGAATGPAYRVLGALETRRVEVSALIAPASGAVAPLSGKLEASTQWHSQGDSLAVLGEALQTQTRFKVDGAVVNGIDLVRAVETVGISRGGETRLDNLNGQVASHGRSVRLHDLVASSGALAARGEMTLSAARALGGRLMVDVTSRKAGLLTVPLEVGGTLDAPSVSLSRSAALGAAIGTVILPGVGTGAGANLGEKLGDKLKGLFQR